MAKKTVQPQSDLIQVVKNGEVIEISPLTLKNHESLGWHVLIDVAVKPGRMLPASTEDGEDASDEPEE